MQQAVSNEAQRDSSAKGLGIIELQEYIEEPTDDEIQKITHWSPKIQSPIKTRTSNPALVHGTYWESVAPFVHTSTTVYALSFSASLLHYHNWLYMYVQNHTPPSP